MKFTGLILICATSCLALILPAIGVVQFPKTSESRYAASSLASSHGLPVSTQSGIASSPTTPPWTYAMPPITHQAMPPSSQQASPFHASTLPPGSLPPGSLPPGTASQPPMTSQSQIEAAGQFNGGVPQLGGIANSGAKLGMSVWLMLVPVCLLGLAMWTFAPNPSGAKSRWPRSNRRVA